MGVRAQQQQQQRGAHAVVECPRPSQGASTTHLPLTRAIRY